MTNSHLLSISSRWYSRHVMLQYAVGSNVYAALSRFIVDPCYTRSACNTLMSTPSMIDCPPITCPYLDNNRVGWTGARRWRTRCARTSQCGRRRVRTARRVTRAAVDTCTAERRAASSCCDLALVQQLP